MKANGLLLTCLWPCQLGECDCPRWRELHVDHSSLHASLSLDRRPLRLPSATQTFPLQQPIELLSHSIQKKKSNV